MPIPILAAAAALAPALAPALAAPAEPAQQHVFSGLTLSPAGDRVAVLEADQRADASEQPHKRLVRSRPAMILA
jgi:hypothetical protein